MGLDWTGALVVWGVASVWTAPFIAPWVRDRLSGQSDPVDDE